MRSSWVTNLEIFFKLQYIYIYIFPFSLAFVSFRLNMIFDDDIDCKWSTLAIIDHRHVPKRNKIYEETQEHIQIAAKILKGNFYFAGCVSLILD